MISINVALVQRRPRGGGNCNLLCVVPTHRFLQFPPPLLSKSPEVGQDLFQGGVKKSNILT